jgi:ligand-binding SRPBCC domain-containing protein
MHAGALIDYRLRLHGVPMHWRTKITEWEPSERFVDEQLVGPYRFWRHEHTFADVDGGTLVRDHVDYAVPGGRLIHWLVVRSDVAKIFEYRRDVLMRRFTPSASPAASPAL